MPDGPVTNGFGTGSELDWGADQEFMPVGPTVRARLERFCIRVPSLWTYPEGSSRRILEGVLNWIGVPSSQWHARGPDQTALILCGGLGSAGCSRLLLVDPKGPKRMSWAI